MISEIVFGNIAKSKMFSYAAEVAFFKANKKIVFPPGLTILFGPNGCGKSTILKIIGLCLAAEQGGLSVVTQGWLQTVIDSSFGPGLKTKQSSVLAPIKVKHDGQPILFGNPRNSVGVRSGRIDDDFFSQGMLNATARDSTGEATMRKLRGMLAALHKDVGFPEEIERRVDAKSVNSVWKEKLAMADVLLAPSIPKGQRTQIFDEPESGLALPVQGNLFDMLHQTAAHNDFQVIVASHSPACLGLAGVNYIDMTPGYLAHSLDFMRYLAQRIENPAMPEPPAPSKPSPAKKAPATTASTKPARKSRTARSFAR